MNKKTFTDVKLHNSHNELKEGHFLKKEDSFLLKEDLDNKKDDSKYAFLEKKKNLQSFPKKRIFTTPTIPQNKKSISDLLLFVFFLVLICGFLYLFSTKFLKAKITIIPKNKIFNLNNEPFRASKQDSPSIPFEIMIVSSSDIKDTVLSFTKEVSEKAKGKIILYNEFSAKSEKINSGTFISDKDGKAYKTDSTVTIPGYKTQAGKIIPGKVSVNVTSFLPGDKYNGSPDFLYVNSFKNTNKYKKIYGKADGEIAGGMTGLIYVLDDIEKNKFLSNPISLNDKLKKQLSSQIPNGYIYYPEASIFSYEIVDGFLSKTPNTKIEIKGTLSAVLIKKENLTNELIKRLLPNIDDKERKEIIPPDISVLNFSFLNSSQNIDKNVSSIDFELTGDLNLDWSPDLINLKNFIVGKHKNEVPELFKKDPGISGAYVKIIPFWINKIPLDQNKIEINIQNLTKN